MSEPEWVKRMEAEGRLRVTARVNLERLRSSVPGAGSATSPATVATKTTDAVGPLLAAFLACCTEAEFQGFVANEARARGWYVVHLRKTQKKNGKWETPVAYDGKGFVDLILYGTGRVLHAELKTDTGRRTPEQEEWQARIKRAGLQYRLWRPGMWPAIKAELEGH